MSRETVQRVIDSGNCSACGACVLTGVADRMELSAEGHLRPVPAPAPNPVAPALSDYCPGLVVDRPQRAAGARRDPYFGDYLAVWSGWAADPELRFKGSSGGALSALARAAMELDEVDAVAMAIGEDRGSRTRADVVADPAALGQYASSRYAPVSTLAILPAEPVGTAIVCRPCEASALRQLRPAGVSFVLAFFCAGVPSQQATDQLITEMGGVPDTVTGLRYRGNGWPGFFRFDDERAVEHRTSYDDSWGAHLGKRVQPRCKICVDGVGESADVVAGDIWEADDKGFPLFDEAPGVSVIIARTPRGLQLVRHAIAAGHLVAQEQDINELHAVQPAQVTRRQFVAARLAGRALAGKPIPRYRGFGLSRLALARPREAIRQLRGTYRRSRSR